jgi:hypothetical protein
MGGSNDSEPSDIDVPLRLLAASLPRTNERELRIHTAFRRKTPTVRMWC